MLLTLLPAATVDAVPSASSDGSDETVEDPITAAKTALREAAKAANRGFASPAGANPAARRALDALVALAPAGEKASVDGTWTLLWTDAPDILGLDAAPFTRLGRIGQVIDETARTIINVIEYGPSSWAPEKFRADCVEQRIILDYTKGANDEYDVSIRGVGLRPLRVLALEFDRRFDAVGAFGLPFGKFTVLFNDGDIRVVRTAQGYYAVNEKVL